MAVPDNNIIRKIISYWHSLAGELNEDNQIRLINAYKAFADTTEGKIVLNDLLFFSGVGDDPHVPGDSHQTARNTGLQRLGLRILNMMSTDINQYVMIKKELSDDQKNTEQANQPKTAIT